MTDKRIEICNKKRPFSTKSAAKKASKVANKHLGNGKRALTVYKCEFCDYWHMTKRINLKKHLTRST